LKDTILERRELEIYIRRGKLLYDSARDISQNILNVINTNLSSSEPQMFFFVEASSGTGKSQLAESLHLPVVYIPLTTGQLIYQCFRDVQLVIAAALDSDKGKLYNHNPSCDIMTTVRSRNLISHESSFRTLGLLVSLYKTVFGKTNEESIKLLSGFNGSITLDYLPMTLKEARKEIRSLLADNIGNELIPLFVIDEVPSLEDAEQYTSCILLRNFIRCMQCVCLLSGTEAAAMNAVDKIPVGSRGESTFEYLRLIIKLPPTKWCIFQDDVKYSALITSLDSDICDMLKRSRPLFVQYVLNALEEDKIAKDSISSSSSSSSSDTVGKSCRLTCSVLSKVKKEILSKKNKFTSNGGLYAQLALLHSDFIASTVDRISSSLTTKSRKRKHVDIVELDDLLAAEKQFCVRHHFGELRVARTTRIHANITIGSTLSLFLDPAAPSSMKVTTKEGSLETFRPNVVFAAPKVDPLLYLLCFRDGIYHGEAHNRVSTSFGLSTIFNQRMAHDLPLFLNTNQYSSSGKFLEMEIASAAIVASHSYPEALSGCPLPFFLRALIAELNVASQFVSHDNFVQLGVPPQYEAVTVGLLSPANASWEDGKSDRPFMRQESEIMLCNHSWSSNSDRNDGAFCMLYDSKVFKGSMEAKCHKKNVPTVELCKTITNTKCNGDLLTIMIVSMAGSIKGNNKNFNEVKQNTNVIKITGNASQKSPRATELRWESLHESTVNPPKPTVVMIALESIYFGRYATMKDIYSFL